MAATVKVSAQLSVRLRADIKQRIEKAAVLSGKTVTEFAVAALADVSDKVLERPHVTELSDRDRDLFLEILDKTSQPNKALKRAARTHKRLIAK